MVNELERLLSNSYAPYDNICFSAIVTTKDKKVFGGVSVKNAIFRDTIYAEQAAIARAVTLGYRYKDFDTLYLMVSTNDLNDLKYINKDMILEFFEPDREIFLYNIKREVRVIKVGNLISHIY